VLPVTIINKITRKTPDIDMFSVVFAL